MTVPRLMEQRFLLLEREFAKATAGGALLLEDGARINVVFDVDDIRVMRVLLQLLVDCVLHGNPLLADVLIVSLLHLLHNVLRQVEDDEASRAELHLVVAEALAKLVIGSVDLIDDLGREKGEDDGGMDERVDSLSCIPPLVVTAMAGGTFVTSPMMLGPVPPLLCTAAVAEFLRRLEREGVGMACQQGQGRGARCPMKAAWDALLDMTR